MMSLDSSWKLKEFLKIGVWHGIRAVIWFLSVGESSQLLLSEGGEEKFFTDDDTIRFTRGAEPIKDVLFCTDYGCILVFLPCSSLLVTHLAIECFLLFLGFFCFCFHLLHSTFLISNCALESIEFLALLLNFLICCIL